MRENPEQYKRVSGHPSEFCVNEFSQHTKNMLNSGFLRGAESIPPLSAVFPRWRGGMRTGRRECHPGILGILIIGQD